MSEILIRYFYCKNTNWNIYMKLHVYYLLCIVLSSFLENLPVIIDFDLTLFVKWKTAWVYKIHQNSSGDLKQYHGCLIAQRTTVCLWLCHWLQSADLWGGGVEVDTEQAVVYHGQPGPPSFPRVWDNCSIWTSASEDPSYYEPLPWVHAPHTPQPLCDR